MTTTQQIEVPDSPPGVMTTTPVDPPIHVEAGDTIHVAITGGEPMVWDRVTRIAYGPTDYPEALQVVAWPFLHVAQDACVPIYQIPTFQVGQRTGPGKWQHLTRVSESLWVLEMHELTFEAPTEGGVG